MLRMQGILPHRIVADTTLLFNRKRVVPQPQGQQPNSALSQSIAPTWLLPLLMVPARRLGMGAKVNLIQEETPPASAPLRLVRPRYKLMSYNAEQFYKTGKGKFVKPMESIHALAKAIQLEDPDVIALQEVGNRALLEEFNTKFLNGQYPNIVSVPFLDAGPMRVAMMSKANIRVVEAKSHWREMSRDAAYPGKRDFLEATFETSTGYRFTVYNAHCHSMRGGEAETQPIRLKEVTNVAKILKEHLQQNPDAQIFVAGDFNTLPDSPYGKPVLQRLTHVQDDTAPDLVEVMMKDDKVEPTHNGHGHHPNNKLDYIFVSSPMAKQVVNAYVAGDFDHEPWRIASDHAPYVTIFEEPAKVAASHATSRNAGHADALLQPRAKRKKLNLIA